MGTTAAKKPVEKKEKKVKTPKTTSGTKKTRRSPFALVSALKEKRAKIEADYQERIQKIDSKIEKLETKHEARIKISELVSTKTPEELKAEFEALQKQQKLLRKALKTGKKVEPVTVAQTEA